MRQGEFPDKDAYSHLWDFDFWPFKTATADADEEYSRMPKQNTGGSDALCLETPPCPRVATG